MIFQLFRNGRNPRKEFSQISIPVWGFGLYWNLYPRQRYLSLVEKPQGQAGCNLKRCLSRSSLHLSVPQVRRLHLFDIKQVTTNNSLEIFKQPLPVAKSTQYLSGKLLTEHVT